MVMIMIIIMIIIIMIIIIIINRLSVEKTQRQNNTFYIVLY